MLNGVGPYHWCHLDAEYAVAVDEYQKARLVQSARIVDAIWAAHWLAAQFVHNV